MDMLEFAEQMWNMENATRPMTLNEPACEVGCSTCLMGCAILPSRLAWWAGEIERLYRERAFRPGDRELRGQLETALSAHEALARRYAASPRGGFGGSLLRQVPRAAFAVDRLH